MQTKTPEAYLSTLVRRLRAVDAATSYLDDDARDSFSAELRQAQRDCQMTSLLYDHTVIAVAGDQGAGKTRLMRLLYDLDANWLDDKPGRGEYLPVLVLEDPNVGEVQGAI
jgi:energy-coupling factor transporter ATP-binding protein EcfA2